MSKYIKCFLAGAAGFASINVFYILNIPFPPDNGTYYISLSKNGPTADPQIVDIEKPAKVDSEHTTSGFNAAEYEQQLKASLIALPDAKTTSHSREFLAGLCNQYMRFLGLIFLSEMEGYSQILEESIAWKDTYGHDDFVPHYMLWDVVHWNTFYPTLPRFASFDEKIHTDLKLVKTSVDQGGSTFLKRTVEYNVTGDIFVTATKPPPLGQNPMQGKNKYKQFVKSVQNERAARSHPVHLEMYKTILKGALRPHPFLQSVIDKIRDQLGAGDKGYMVLHARVEPDMVVQNERVCKDLRVMNMTQIIDMIYEKFPEPPVNTVLIVFARTIMEEYGNNKKNEERCS